MTESVPPAAIDFSVAFTSCSTPENNEVFSFIQSQFSNLTLPFCGVTASVLDVVLISHHMLFPLQ